MPLPANAPRLRAVATLLGVLFTSAAVARQRPAPPPAQQASPHRRVEPKVHSAPGWAIAAPGDWQVLRGPPSPTRLIYLIGDGREGIPLFDGTLSPLKAGLLIERFPNPNGVALNDFVERDMKVLTDSGRFQPIGEPRLEPITLADGSAALLLRTEFVRLENRRLSIHRKLYAQDAQKRHLVATGFITCSRPGRSFVNNAGLTDFLEAHVTSLVLDPARLDATKLKPAYDKHAWGAATAVQQTRRGNALLEKEDHAAAAETFRAALKECDHVPAARNGLAWALMHAPGAGEKEVQAALAEATTAVAQTERLDYAALDTLALAQFRAGQKEEAIKSVREALKLRPNHPELLERLKSFGAQQ